MYLVYFSTHYVIISFLSLLTRFCLSSLNILNVLYILSLVCFKYILSLLLIFEVFYIFVPYVGVFLLPNLFFSLFICLSVCFLCTYVASISVGTSSRLNSFWTCEAAFFGNKLEDASSKAIHFNYNNMAFAYCSTNKICS